MVKIDHLLFLKSKNVLVCLEFGRWFLWTLIFFFWRNVILQQSFPFRFYQLPTQSPQTPLPPPKRGFSFYSLFTAFMEQNFAGKFSLKRRVLLIAPYSPTLHFFTDKRCNIEKIWRPVPVALPPYCKHHAYANTVCIGWSNMWQFFYSIPKSVLCSFLYIIYF